VLKAIRCGIKFPRGFETASNRRLPNSVVDFRHPKSNLPSVSEPSLKEILAVATDAAYAAGRRTLAWFNTPLAVDTKSDGTPVTCADRAAEEIIRGAIGKHFPDHRIVGEEFGDSAGNPDFKWIVDPIDGTKSFIRRVPLYGVLIGVEVKGLAEVGVIYLPATDELIAAATGLGCTWNGRPAHVSSVSNLADATMLVSGISSLMRRRNALDLFNDKTKLIRGWGDCFGYAMVATGRADIMVDSGLQVWDAAPLLPILREAGGQFTNWAGDPTIYGPDAVGTNGILHREVLSILNASKTRTPL
jgi:histidinol-phosphatase